MASSGIRRKVDDLGRVVIPASIRRALGIREGDAVEVTVEGERVVLARPQDACVFCGREDATLQGFRGRLVCVDCVGRIGEVAGRGRTDEADASAPTPAPTVTSDAPAPTRAPTVTSDPASRPAPTSPRAPDGFPNGPIDGDAMARDAAARHDDDRPRRRPRPPYDPASTTSW